MLKPVSVVIWATETLDSPLHVDKQPLASQLWEVAQISGDNTSKHGEYANSNSTQKGTWATPDSKPGPPLCQGLAPLVTILQILIYKKYVLLI